MGFTIFTSSGTFDPKIYGLSAGDLIHIRCVGGGGAGGSGHDHSSYNGSNGNPSSFGSILSAAGGYHGVSGSYNLPTAQAGSCQGSNGGVGSLPSGDTTATTYYGGSGGHGWLPGITLPTTAGCVLTQVPTFAAAATSSPYVRFHPAIDSNSLINCFGNFAPFTEGFAFNPMYGEQTGTFGGYGGCFYRNSRGYYLIGGAGGVGYGAGGGGCGSELDSRNSYCSGSGGNGGVIADADHVLTSGDSIAVTVGAGGVGYGDNAVSGGGGARGCVAIWW